MNPKKIEKRICYILRNQLMLPHSVKVNGASTIESLGADSLDAIEFVMAVEDRFDLEIPDEIGDTWTTVQDILDYVIQQKPEIPQYPV